MDNDDEMMTAGPMLQAHATASAEIDKRLAIITCLVSLLAEMNATPRIGGSKKGRDNNKYRQRTEVHFMLVFDYFADEPTHGTKDFR